MAHTITIVNRSLRMVTFHAPRELGTETHRLHLQERSRAAQAIGWREVERELPCSVTLLPKGQAGDNLPGLPASIEHAHEVAALIRRGELEAVRVDVPQDAQKEASEAFIPNVKTKAAAAAPKE